MNSASASRSRTGTARRRTQKTQTTRFPRAGAAARTRPKAGRRTASTGRSFALPQSRRRKPGRGAKAADALAGAMALGKRQAPSSKRGTLGMLAIAGAGAAAMAKRRRGGPDEQAVAPAPQPVAAPAVPVDAEAPRASTARPAGESGT